MNELELLREHRDRQPEPSPVVIAEARARLSADAGPKPRRARHRRYAFAAAGVAVAASAAVIAPAVVDTDGASQAYAVERMPDGTIKVTLREFTDSRGLERKLRSMGVRVAVEYHKEKDQRCAFPRGKLVQRHPASPVIDSEYPQREREYAKQTWMIFPQLIKPGQTLVWTMIYDLDKAGPGQSSWSMGFRYYLVEGPVEPCLLTPFPTRSRPSGSTS